jgi:hypothetical protein
MYHPTIPLVALVFLSQTYSRFIEPGVVPINPIHLQRRGIDQAVLLNNGQEAQKLNAKFSGMNPNSPCNVGDSACISGGFSQCVGGKYVGGPCAGGLKCFAMRELISKSFNLCGFGSSDPYPVCSLAHNELYSSFIEEGNFLGMWLVQLPTRLPA